MPILSSRPFLAVLVLAASSAACLEPPSVGRAAAPGESNAGGPIMGSTTSNEALKKKVELLEQLLDGKIDVAAAARSIDEQFRDLPAEEQEQRLGNLRAALADAGQVGGGKAVPPGPVRDMILARLYFSERRFIEAAGLLSRVLDIAPRFPAARNLLARCFYFLGNPDRTLTELEFILNDPEQGRQVDERLDALFLIGATVVDQPGATRENLERGLRAWETYLQEAPSSPQRAQVEQGLEEIRAGLRGEGRLAEAKLVRREATPHSGQNVMGGEASFDQPSPSGPSGGGAERPAPERVKQLPADASPYAKAAAAGLDALDSGDLAGAESQLRAANDLNPNQPEILVGLGRVFVQTRRIDDALRTFGEAIKLHPGYMPAWHYNGMAHMMSGDARQAAESWEQILRQDPAYAQRFSLDKRIEVARRMAR
ncbi:MAG: tetratricopeptide repeat protein [Myxococcota bacterium]